MRLLDPVAEDNVVTNEILRAIHRGDPALIVDSPPGAGKTTLGTKIAATAAGLLKESIMIATWTNRQAIDFAHRTARTYPRAPVTLFLKEKLAMLVPDSLFKRTNFQVINSAPNLPPGGVIVSNASKWTASEVPYHYDWLLVDEAYQIPEYRFRRLAPMADRYVLVGDPGQIAPLIQSDTSLWGCDPDGPHVPCTTAALARHDLEIFNLPVSWRLPTDTAQLVRDAFYDFHFTSGDPEGLRALSLGPRSGRPADDVLDTLVASDGSIAVAILDGDKIATNVDSELAEFAAESVAALLGREAVATDEKGRSHKLAPADIGVVTAHRAQVTEIDKRLRAKGVHTGEGGTVVETTERWQGLERKVMVVHHPLAGLNSL